MKRIFLLMCVVALCVSLAGCSKSFSMEKPVNVYYCAISIKNDSPTGMLQAEKRDLQGWQDNLRGFLNEYLAGPISSKLSSPFPAKGSIISLEETNNTIHITLNSHFLVLTPSELMLSYACLSKTLFELSDVEAVNLHIESTDTERSSITITRDNIWLTDTANFE